MTRRLLIVEDDPGLQSQIKWSMPEALEVTTAGDRESAIAEFRRFEPQVVTLDLGLPPDPGGATIGLGILRELLELDPRTKVIVLTGREETDFAVQAIGAGAHDYYQKPTEADTLAFVVDRAFRLHELEEDNRRLLAREPASPLAGIIGASDAIQSVCRMTERLATADVTVMILGETGTGKELFARAIHELSDRADAPFSAINCAAIPENLLESELFGHEKGAFTGATSQKPGKIELASSGTLFLDEIGDLPLPLQVKLLRFLQERVIERIGGRTTIPVDVRVVCATHRNLEDMIRSGGFREDLYYRVSEVTIRLPPLRERAGDAVLIARSILGREREKQGRSNVRFTDDTERAIQQHEWPGNIRELENRVKRAIILCDSNRILPEDLELTVDADAPSDQPLNLRVVREEAERSAIRQALASAEGNIAKTARMLGVARPTLYGLLEKLGIDADVSGNEQG